MRKLVWLAVFLAGCATTPKLTPMANPPRLIGTWKGEWGGNMKNPPELMVERQDGGTLAGRMRIVPAQGHSSASGIRQMRGSVGLGEDGTPLVLLDVEGREFVLGVVSEQKLEGTGKSEIHSGPVVLNRE